MPGIKFLPAPEQSNVAWVFKGENYGRIEWAPGSVPSVVLQPATPISEGWPSLVQAGFNHVDAAVRIGEETWFFCGDRMAAVKIEPHSYIDTLVKGPCPLTEWNSLKEIGFTSIDAVHLVPDHPDEYFVFSGHNCARISRNPDQVVHGSAPILERWAIPFVSIDTVLPHPTELNDVYMFTGLEYIQLTIAPGTKQDKIHHEPYRIARNWPALVALKYFDPANVLVSAEFELRGGKRTTLWEVPKAPNYMSVATTLMTHLGFNHLGENGSPVWLHTVWRTESGERVEGSVIFLNEVLGAKNDKLYWGGKDFHYYAKAIEITGNVSDPDKEVPRIALLVKFDHCQACIDLTGMLELETDNKVIALIPTVLQFRTERLDEIGRKMDKFLEEHAKNMTLVKVSAPSGNNGYSDVKEDTWYTTATSGTKTVAFGVQAHTAEAKAVVARLAGKHFEADFLSVEADAHAEPLGYFANAGVYVAKVKDHGFELDAGLAVGFGAGIQDGSLEVEGGIFDISIGKKTGIHLFGIGGSIDFSEACSIM